MDRQITLTQEQLVELYKFMEQANEVFHQPKNYKDNSIIESFASSNYPIIKKYYYDVLWDKLPQPMRDRILSE